MTVPERPAPPPIGRLASIQQWFAAQRQRLRPDEPVVEPFDLDRVVDTDDVFGPASRPTGIWTALIAIGAALLAVGALWGWQSWSQRSAPPIDDLLPRFDPSTAETAPATPQGTPPEVPAAAASTTAGLAPVPASRAEPVQLVVHVSGSVRSPGVVTLDLGARVYQAVAAAGGATDEADLDRVNLAAPAGDGERIHVPALGETVAPQVVQPSRPADSIQEAEPTPIDLNTATAAMLEDLRGVGPSTAQAIVQTRQERGPFLSVEELLEVPGIGNAKLELLAPFVTVG